MSISQKEAGGASMPVPPQSPGPETDVSTTDFTSPSYYKRAATEKYDFPDWENSPRDSKMLDASREELESQHDFWVNPEELGMESRPVLRRTMGLLEFVAVVTLISSGAYSLANEHALKKWTDLNLYVFASLSADVAVFLFAMIVFSASRCEGRSFKHAAACLSIWCQVFQSIACYLLVGYGIHFLKKYGDQLLDHKMLGLFLGLETVISFIFVISSCPVIIGGICYAIGKIVNKIRREPVVTFYQSQQPTPWYAKYFDNYQDSLELMHRPAPRTERNLAGTAADNDPSEKLLESSTNP